MLGEKPLYVDKIALPSPHVKREEPTVSVTINPGALFPAGDSAAAVERRRKLGEMMPKPIKPPATRRFRLFSSIRAKIAMILLAMTATSAAVGVMVFLVFERISTDMSELRDGQLPRLEVSTAINSSASKTKNNLISLMMADGGSVLSSVRDEAEATIAELQSHILKLDEANRPALDQAALDAKVALDQLATARGTLLRSQEAIGTLIADMQVTSESMQEKMRQMSEKAYANLTTGGEAAVETIDKSMSRLIDEDFELMQNLLEARSEVNLLSGTAIALGLAQDAGMSATLQEIADTSIWKLGALVRRMEGTGQTMLDIKVLRDSSEVLSSVVKQSLFPSASLRRAAIEARNKADGAISEAIDTMSLELMIGAQTVNSTNREEIRALLEGEVQFLSTLLDINSAVSQFQVNALGVVTSRNLQQVEAAAVGLRAASKTLSEFADFDGGALFSAISRISRITDKSSGLVALKKATIDAEVGSVAASQATEAAVMTIAALAGELSDAVQAEITSMAENISGEIAIAERNMLGIVGGAAAVFVVSLLLTQLWISTPLKKISAATERLAEGDRSPVSGFERASLEIASIARSLSIFRDGLVEKEEISKQASEERRVRQETQNAAVAALASGLSDLSRGDLTARIEQPLGEGYEKLRADFNATIDTLNQTMVQLVEGAASIQGGASEISQASDDLSQRTEAQAATLEETAASLDELTASVKSAAEGARDVERTVGEARTEAEASGQVVQNAVAAMTEIEASSTHISQIISVIDDIAFQTNLLALNAGVEAARAGEAGRGFAVVASEVRALAQRSSDAAMEIKTLISSSSKQVESGVELVGQAGDALQSIMTRVNHIAELVSDIANGAEEQSTGLVEINTGMNQLDQVTQQNAAMVEEATAAGHLLNSDSTKLAEMVSKFQTDGNRERSVDADAGSGPSAYGNGLGDFEASLEETADDDWLTGSD
ncbi:MAG: methyl-accepting chemotaxis protein [Epibacterium sp.]|nr:methyl-accepting chemotaxis protein [Epibacterium sp.]